LYKASLLYYISHLGLEMSERDAADNVYHIYFRRMKNWCKIKQFSWLLRQYWPVMEVIPMVLHIVYCLLVISICLFSVYL